MGKGTIITIVAVGLLFVLIGSDRLRKAREGEDKSSACGCGS
jgi:hypothetical protein